MEEEQHKPFAEYEKRRDFWSVKGKHQLLSEMVNEYRETVKDKTKGCWSLGHRAD